MSLFELHPDHAPRASGNNFPHPGHVLVQTPVPARCVQNSSFAKEGQHFPHEQRIALGSFFHNIAESHGKRVRGESAVQIQFDVHTIQEPQRDIVADAVALQCKPHRKKRVSGRQKFRGPVSRNDQNRDVLHPQTQIAQQVAGRWIGPMHVLEHQHMGTSRGHRFEQMDKLPPHSLM